MKNVLKQFEIANLLAKKILKQQSKEQDEEIAHWLKDDNEEIYRSIMALDDYNLIQKDIQEVDTKEGWKYVKKRIAPEQNPVKKMLPKIMRYAASIIIALGITGSIFYFGYIGLFKSGESQVVENIIPPGVRKAELVLNDGRKITLDKNFTNPIYEKDGSTIVNVSETLDYKKFRKNFGKKDLYNNLNIKHGWEYQVTLSDGTKIWLNSVSELKYPVHFIGKERVVELNGEAYFEVAHNPEKPFVVKTSAYNVEVLGTSFNISHYQDDPVSHVTLSEGKIKIVTSGQSNDVASDFTLIPGQQYYFNKEDNSYDIKEVEPSDYSGWIGGYFVFEQENLESIFKKLTRWYNVNYSFEKEELKKVIFSGKLPRFENFRTILEMMQKVSEINFKLENNTVSIHKN